MPAEFPLEGILRESGTKVGVVICHPHPLYGGSMNNNVVDAIEEGFSARGFTTLKFNFRGVGMSSGDYDEGEGEVRDAAAAMAFLRQHLDNGSSTILAGYSFGAWVASRAAAAVSDLNALFLVAYPFAFYKFDELMQFNGRIYLVGGEYDDISPADSLRKAYSELPSREKSLKIISTDHFYSGKEGEIVEFIKAQVAS